MFKAKFKVNSVTVFEGDNVQVAMSPIMGDNDFTKYTPSGKLEFLCSNPEVNKQLTPGKVFEITFAESE